MRHELQQRVVPVPAADPPAGLQLAQVTAFIAAAAGGLERLAGAVGAARPTQR